MLRCGLQSVRVGVGVVGALVLAVLVRFSFSFDYSRPLSELGGSWMSADVALDCGWSAVGRVGGGGGCGGGVGGVVLAGRVVAAVLGLFVLAMVNGDVPSAVTAVLFFHFLVDVAFLRSDALFAPVLKARAAARSWGFSKGFCFFFRAIVAVALAAVFHVGLWPAANLCAAASFWSWFAALVLVRLCF